MFWKKKKESPEWTEAPKKVTTDNILEVFSKDMMKEKQKELSETLAETNPVIYMNKATWVLKVGFFIVLLFSLVLSTYSYIQGNEELRDEPMLESLCFLFLWSEAAAQLDQCGSVSGVSRLYDEKSSNLKKQQSQKILSVLDTVYALDNFLFTEDISFLLEKSASKLPVTTMLSEFNELKDSFEPEKKVYAIECGDVSITNDSLLNMTCNSYSSDWSDSNIMWFNGQTTSKKISGTSITVASSFINFIRKKGQNFQVLDVTKALEYSENLEEWKERYTKKTEFEITLKYVNPLAN